MRIPFFCIGAAALVAFAGCSTGPRIYHVKGTVTYKNAPLPAGVMFFDPAPANDGPQGYAFIKAGAYDTAGTGGKGIIGKAYIVRIQGFDGKPGNELPMGKPLFTKFEESVDFPQQDSVKDFTIEK